MARQSDEERLEKQRERQQEHREADLAEKRPDRDDVARAALFMLISSMAARKADDALENFRSRVLDILLKQGFNERACEDTLDYLIRKYSKGSWPFRRKIHLLYPDGPDTED